MDDYGIQHVRWNCIAYSPKSQLWKYFKQICHLWRLV